jgi:hypothetical protein
MFKMSMSRGSLQFLQLSRKVSRLVLGLQLGSVIIPIAVFSEPKSVITSLAASFKTLAMLTEPYPQAARVSHIFVARTRSGGTLH